MLAALEATDIAIIAAMMIIFALVARARLNSSDGPTLRRIDRKLDVIIQALEIELPETVVSGLSPEVCRLADGNQKIEAIKLHRQQTGAGLKESKDAIEGYLKQ